MKIDQYNTPHKQNKENNTWSSQIMQKKHLTTFDTLSLKKQTKKQKILDKLGIEGS